MTTIIEAPPLQIQEHLAQQMMDWSIKMQRPYFEQQLPPAKRQRTARRCVHFCDERNTVRTRALSDEELRCLWLQDSDYAEIRTDNALSVLALHKQVSAGDTSLFDAEDTSRGLEAAICKYLCGITLSHQRKTAQRIVKQYHLQKKLGFDDPEILRTMSLLLTQNDRIRALQQGTEDAML